MTKKTLAAVASGAAVAATAAYLLIAPKTIQPPPLPPSATLLSSPVNVSLAWTASPDDSVVGYNVYYGNASHSYEFMIPAGTNITATVSNLNIGQTYFFAVTAFDDVGAESDFSNELEDAIPPVIEMTFYFPNDMASASIQSSADLNAWTNASARIVSSTSNSVTARAFVNQDAQYFRAVGVAP